MFRDSVITAKAKRRELLVIAGCFFAACLLNVCSIVVYRTSWSEIFTQAGYVLILTVVIYAVCVLLRLAARLLARLFRKRE